MSGATPRAPVPEVPVTDVLITDELFSRPAAESDLRREIDAIQRLAHVMAHQPDEMLPQLVRLALDVCDAESAGVSILEDASTFRWHGLSGSLSVFEGATTPRDDSPCGLCLDAATAILMRAPERAYGWIAAAGIRVPEVLLVPLLLRGQEPLGTLWIVARDGQAFNREHARLLSELATFSALALDMIGNEKKLAAALQAQETLTREMSHRMKNFFAIADGFVRLTAKHVDGKDEFADAVSGRIRALAHAHALVTGQVTEEVGGGGVAFADVLARVLLPYGDACRFAGPELPLSERAVQDFALIFHELATNAFKYGALSAPDGAVAVTWEVDDAAIEVRWRESGGPQVHMPDRRGFGSILIDTAVARRGGRIDFDWQPAGVHIRLTVPRDRLGGERPA